MIDNGLKYLLLGFLLIAVLLLNINFISADPACEVCTEANCDYNEGIILMHISGSTNAHGALQSQSSFPSNQVVCCYEISEGSDTCTGDNKIIGLSSAVNAHSERPEYDSQDYEDHVCYEFFTSVIATDDPDFVPSDDYIPIISLSSATNTHIGSSSAYPRSSGGFVVYGIVGEGGGEDECSLQEAYWEKEGEKINETNNYVLSGISVGLVVEGNELCNGETIDFTIKEDTTQEIPSGGEISGETFSEGKADATWVSKYINLTDRPPRYFFTGDAGATIESGRDSDSLLTVYDESRSVDVNVCFDYTGYFEPPGSGNPENEKICVADPYEVAAATFPEIDCDSPGADCYCTWNSINDECEGAWETGLGTCIFGNQNITNECNEEPFGTMTFNWTATWDGSGLAPPECKSGPKTVECPAQIPLPFFGIYNFVAALLFIAAVYFVLSFRKLKKKK